MINITKNIRTIDRIVIVIITTFRPICPSAFFRCSMLNSVVNAESRSEPFIQIMGIDCSDSLIHERVQVLSYIKYSLLVLPVVGIEPATFIAVQVWNG